MATRRITALTALRSAPGGAVIGETGKAPVTVEPVGEPVQHGGHDWYEVRAFVRADRMPPPLTFRYVPQLGPRDDASAPEHRNSSECGLASCSMVLSTMGIEASRIDFLSDKYDPDDDGTSAQDLVRMAADYGGKLVAKTYTSLIPEPLTICLGMYAFADRSKLDLPSFTGAHWVVFLEQLPNGDVLIADPLYRTEARGASVRWSITEWARYFVSWRNGLRVGVTPDKRGAVARLVGAGAPDVPADLLNIRNDVVRLY